MRQVLAFATVATVVALLVVAPAGASSTKGPTLRSLAAQVKSLQKQVTSLKKKVTLAQNLALVSLTYDACLTAVSADTFQDTYTGLNGYFGAHALPAYFGAQTPLNDYGACQALEIVRAHNQSPPTTAVLGALLDIFKPTGSALGHQGFVNLARERGYLFGQLFVLSR